MVGRKLIKQKGLNLKLTKRKPLQGLAERRRMAKRVKKRIKKAFPLATKNLR